MFAGVSEAFIIFFYENMAVNRPANPKFQGDAADFTASTRFCGNPNCSQQFPILDLLKHTDGTQDRRLVHFYESDRDLVYRDTK